MSIGKNSVSTEVPASPPEIRAVVKGVEREGDEERGVEREEEGGMDSGIDGVVELIPRELRSRIARSS